MGVAPEYPLATVKVTLPDQSVLELPDGASGLDAARAIGPRLAEQAVLVRANGSIQDLRLPLPEGAAIQILTTRDTQDPDALAVLRHSTAHLLAEAARRLYPGTKVAIGPPIENGFYYDFEFPEAIGEEALERLEEEMKREIAEGRTFERWELDRDEARRHLRGGGRAVQGRARRLGGRPDLLLSPGRLHRSLPGPSPSERRTHQGSQASLPRRRVLAG